MAPSASVRIVPATEKDSALILQFVRDLAEYERLLDRVEATEERVRDTLFSATPAAYCVLAYQGGRPVGFALFYYTYSTFVGLPGLYLEDLFVRPDVRGQGVGRELLQYLARLAKKKGCWRMEWAVLRWNESAIRFYESLGAVAMDEWAFYRLSGDALERLAAEK